MAILDAITQMAESRGLSKEFIVEVIKETLVTVAKNDFGEDAQVDVFLAESDGAIKAFLVKKAVKKVTNSVSEISITDAQKLGKDYKLKDEIRVEFPFGKLTRNSIILAKGLLQQKIREKEKEKVQQKYLTKVGEIGIGTVQKIDRREIVVKLKDAEGVIPLRERIPEEKYYQGDNIKAYILGVTPGGRVLLSRTHPEFLRKLFAQEVPEIQENIVEIKLVARIPGIRAKIAVLSTNPKVDPVGACVGTGGSRIRAVVRELNNERIDVIQYSQEPIVLVSRALSGVNILHEDINLDDGRISIVVKSEELPKAIGKNGQNAMLASKLLSLRIDIISETEFKSKGIALVPEIPKSIKEILIAHGFLTTADILNKGTSELLKLPGIGEKRATKIFEIAKKFTE
ncbi:transcription termination factor NusA [candidate division WOR-3 bacterium]|nr:transcription termination factor NusA [candidate division WOR-3 bacterium]